MSIAPLPTPLQHFGGRRFSFYPPIRNLGPNEWLYRRATWSECVVANAHTGEEVCIPRMFLGEVSRMDEAVMIVGLNRELEWRSGVISPRERSVIVMPAPVNDSGSPRAPGTHIAPVINIRLETKSETRARKWIGVAAILGAVAFTIVADVARQTQSHQRADLWRGYRAYLQLGPDDNYTSTVGKLGPPANVRSRQSGDRVFRALGYPARHYSVILMSSTSTGSARVGSINDNSHYIGTVDQRGRILDQVRLPNSSTSDSLLRSLPTF